MKFQELAGSRVGSNSLQSGPGTDPELTGFNLTESGPTLVIDPVI